MLVRITTSLSLSVPDKIIPPHFPAGAKDVGFPPRNAALAAAFRVQPLGKRLPNGIIRVFFGQGKS
jgi:hypothetical protein